MAVKSFRIRSCFNQPIPANWREHLVSLLGASPRRLSTWCELGMYGALSCISSADGEDVNSIILPSSVPIRVMTQLGTVSSTLKAIDQMADDLPMPFTFLQTQPGQLINALGTVLKWHGDALTTTGSHREFGEAWLLRSIQQSLLFAEVDEQPHLISRWIWLELAEIFGETNWRPIRSVFDAEPHERLLKIDDQQQLYTSNDW